MYNTQIKNSVLEKFLETFAEKKAENLKDLELKQFMKDNDSDLVSKSVDQIKANAVIAIPDGYSVPKTTVHVRCSGDGKSITLISITLCNKIHATKVFKFKGTFCGESVVDDIADFFQGAYAELLVDSLASENVKVVNELLEELSEDLEYKVGLTTTVGGSDSKIAFISDEEVVFNVDMDRIFEVEDILALYDPDEDFSQEDINEAKETIKDELIKAQTTEQLVQAHGTPFIAYFANINKATKATTLLKKITGKKAENLSANAGGIGYYTDGDVFALVAMRDGAPEVILSPFDTTTFRKVDVDVLAKIGK